MHKFIKILFYFLYILFIFIILFIIFWLIFILCLKKINIILMQLDTNKKILL